MRHYEQTAMIAATPVEVFAFADDHRNFSAHMNESSLMMAGSSMETVIDEGGGQKVGSHIKMSGKVLGIPIDLNEVVVERVPPQRKVWETVGTPHLLVVGSYVLGFEITPKDSGSSFRVFIEYGLPHGYAQIMGLLLGKIYAKWCVGQMARSVRNHFSA